MSDPELVEILSFKDVGELLKAFFPGRQVSLTVEAEQYLENLLSSAAVRASLARRLECRGRSFGFSDALWAAQETCRKAQAAMAGGRPLRRTPQARRAQQRPGEIGGRARAVLGFAWRGYLGLAEFGLDNLGVAVRRSVVLPIRTW